MRERQIVLRQQRIEDKLLTPELINNYLFKNLEEVECELHLVTLILSLIISDEVENTESVPQLFGYLQENFDKMSSLDQGIYWYLKGYLAWKSDRSLYHALSCLNRSRDILFSLTNPFAQFYLPRVYDSFGQISHNMGHLEDAGWYLPAIDEFLIMYQNRAQINKTPF